MDVVRISELNLEMLIPDGLSKEELRVVGSAMKALRVTEGIQTILGNSIAGIPLPRKIDGEISVVIYLIPYVVAAQTVIHTYERGSEKSIDDLEQDAREKATTGIFFSETNGTFHSFYSQDDQDD